MANNKAAFIRIEGPLLKSTSLSCVAWMSAKAQTFADRLAGLGTVALALPYAMNGVYADPTRTTELGFAALKGMTEDRITILGEEWFESRVQDHIRPLGRDMLERARANGHRIILVSDNLDLVVTHVARLLRVDDVICNRMEWDRDGATGKLAEPTISRLSVEGMATYADAHEIDLGDSCAYGSTMADSGLLIAVGHPCVVFPDRALRALARDSQWPVAEE